ncbi:MAG: UDP-N-acetylmuramate:L-alanyl-gamma-D-glutamyl-meso-diaminopimelate ligase [Deltaproteobacteria bacterium]|nr:UDP-N-acetylmuramate:L-alanyl-gamma-D-glutamyl-meso-diaminopimelate ligase [Deltaproteobacteria bacterium]
MKIHLIGIAGTGMGSLAGLLRAAGHEVRGSDEHVYPPMSTQLSEQGIAYAEGFGPQNLDWGPDVVVVGNVCRRDHVEVVAAKDRRIPLTSFPALLSELFLSDHQSVVIAGTHGKTTTSTLMAHVLTQAGRDPSFLIGGVPNNFERSWRLGRGEEFVVEGDEYDTAFFDKKSKFLHYKPKIVILTSVEFDHADIFRDEDVVVEAFREFVERIPPAGDLIVCAASPKAMEVARSARCQVTTYGRPGFGADWTFEISSYTRGGRAVMRVAYKGHVVGNIESGLPGVYNLENLMGVIAAASRIGVSLPQIARASQRFLGVRRRQEWRGIAAGVTVLDDFAHHPTAVRETLTALKGRFGPGKMITAFEPRSATSRRKVFQNDFASALSVSDEVLLAPLYQPEKLPEDDRLDVELLAKDLRNGGVPARVIDSVDATVDRLVERAAPGDTVVVMSSGSYGGLHDKLLEKLGDPVRPAKLADKPHISNLLNRVGIAHPQLDEFWSHYLVIPGDGDVPLVGCVAIERVEDVGLLRMLAVAPERRGEGLGYLLVDTATEKSRREGMKDLYLVTDGASSFFAEKLGWQPIDRKECDYAITTTREYRMARAEGATWMRKVL